ncbi:MAG: SANT/Myb-like DNA-binding domain-containing protein, partial [Candidatus Nanohaloarchaea archaeon]|nr:SANT/Myb-like DNA-binding domain-containing protein [Candidatus Nanohaloarchaea archaeon]
PEVSRAMSRKGIGTRHPPDWTDEEDEILREHYHHWPKKRILNALDRRTWKAIIDRARKIGVARSAEEHRHSKAVKDRLRTNAEENRIEIDFGATDHLSYIIGVVDGDGFHDGEGTIGLENTSPRFVEKFREALETVGMNPGRSRRRGNMETVWAASQQLVEWIDGKGYEEKRTWLDSPGDGWKYIEGRYESDGNIHPSGSPRICSYDRRARRFIHRLLQERGISCSIQQNNVWISRPAADDFFDNINPVIRKQE